MSSLSRFNSNEHKSIYSIWFNSNLNQYHTFANTSRTFYQLNTYVSQDNNVNYNFLFYSNSGVMMTKGKCTFIRIAWWLFKIRDSSRYCFSIFFVLEHSQNILKSKMEHCYCVVCLQKNYLRKCLWELKSAKYFKKK